MIQITSRLNSLEGSGDFPCECAGSNFVFTVFALVFSSLVKTRLNIETFEENDEGIIVIFSACLVIRKITIWFQGDETPIVHP